MTVRVPDTSRPVVTESGHLTREWARLIERIVDDTNTDVSTVDGRADNAQHVMYGDPSSYVWNADGAGVYPAGNPTVDLTMNVEDKTGANVATRVLQGALNSGTGDITVTNVSSSGLSTSYTVKDDGSNSVRADIVVTFADNTQATASLSWSSMDPSTAGGTPTTGRPK